MARRDAHIDAIEDALSPLGPVECRHMFGGFGAFLDGAMLGVVAGGVLYLKVDGHNVAAFDDAGLEPFVIESRRGRTEMSFRRAPEPIGDWDALGPWARGALAAAERARDARRPRRPRPPARG
ncbi:MAG: TfoX/Sxy family protein [Thermoleophilia bacterium]